MKKQVANTIDTILAQNGYTLEDYLNHKGYKLDSRIRPKLMKVDEAAIYLGCCRATIYNLIEKGLLNPNRGIAGTRIAIEEADRLIKETCNA